MVTIMNSFSIAISVIEQPELFPNYVGTCLFWSPIIASLILLFPLVAYQTKDNLGYNPKHNEKAGWFILNNDNVIVDFCSLDDTRFILRKSKRDPDERSPLKQMDQRRDNIKVRREGLNFIGVGVKDESHECEGDFRMSGEHKSYNEVVDDDDVLTVSKAFELNLLGIDKICSNRIHFTVLMISIVVSSLFQIWFSIINLTKHKAGCLIIIVLTSVYIIMFILFKIMNNNKSWRIRILVEFIALFCMNMNNFVIFFMN